MFTICSIVTGEAIARITQVGLWAYDLLPWRVQGCFTVRPSVPEDDVPLWPDDRLVAVRAAAAARVIKGAASDDYGPQKVRDMAVRVQGDGWFVDVPNSRQAQIVVNTARACGIEAYSRAIPAHFIGKELPRLA